MTVDMNTWLFVLVLVANVLGLLLYESRRELRIAKNQLQDYEFQEMERERLEEEFKMRPVQAMVPRDAIEILGQAIIHYLSHQLNQPMEVPIFPREPKETK